MTHDFHAHVEKGALANKTNILSNTTNNDHESLNIVSQPEECTSDKDKHKATVVKIEGKDMSAVVSQSLVYTL